MPEPKPAFKQALALAQDYFLHSDEKLSAWLLLIGSLLCIMTLVALITIFSWWSAGFWGILTAKALEPFIIAMAQFCVLAFTYVAVDVLQNYLLEKLTINWRAWLTQKTTLALFKSENNYLELRRQFPEIDNISQRIQEDIKFFVELSLKSGTTLFRSVLSIAAFVGTLWVVGGALAITIYGAPIVIPGYLVWVALASALLASTATHYIGKALSNAMSNREKIEADLRQELTELIEEAENIAEEHAEDYYKTSLLKKIDTLRAAETRGLRVRTRLVAFQSFYRQVSSILPTLLAAPLYFLGQIELGQVMQIGVAFSEISQALSWFIDGYQDLAKYKTCTTRLDTLQQALREEIKRANNHTIARKISPAQHIEVEHLNIASPNANDPTEILKDVNLKFIPGEHTLIKGPSGTGKSTLFKAISGTWKYGDGSVFVPRNKTLYFLPQKPTLPHDTLKAVLAYPEPAETYTTAEYTKALEDVGGMAQFVARLDETCTWSKNLSGGQQQKISFARALLKKPDWLFLDEATSALDEASEARIYKTATENMPNTTVVSIAHRNTVEKYHKRHVFFKPDAPSNPSEDLHSAPAMAV